MQDKLTKSTGSRNHAFSTALLERRNSSKSTESNRKPVDFHDCYASWTSWSLSSNEWVRSNLPTSTETNTGVANFTVAVAQGPSSTLCDGIPRLAANYSSASVITTTVAWSFVETYLDVNAAHFTLPMPTCSFETSECRELWQSHSSTSLAPLGRRLLELNGIQGLLDPLEPPCYNPDPDCVIEAKQFALLYWPVSATSRNLCGRDEGQRAETIFRRAQVAPRKMTTDAITFEHETFFGESPFTDTSSSG
jgi:hypothetical protein